MAYINDDDPRWALKDCKHGNYNCAICKEIKEALTKQRDEILQRMKDRIKENESTENYVYWDEGYQEVKVLKRWIKLLSSGHEDDLSKGGTVERTAGHAEGSSPDSSELTRPKSSSPEHEDSVCCFHITGRAGNCCPECRIEGRCKPSKEDDD